MKAVSVVVRDETGAVYFEGSGQQSHVKGRSLLTIPFQMVVAATAPFPYPQVVTVEMEQGAACRAVAFSVSCSGQYQIEIDSVTYELKMDM